MTLPQQDDAALYVGLDVGGTKLLVAGADADGRILRRVKQPTPLALDEGLDALHRMIETVTGGREITAMAAAIGGPLDWRTGVVSPLHQPEWRQIPLAAIMTERYRCRFHVDVDTNICAVGEYHFGGLQAKKLLYVTLSTGMGGGFLVDGQVYRGKDGEHPEIAHQSINFRCSRPERVTCECGGPDCLEALISGNGIRRVYGKPAENLDEHEWAEVAYNLGQGLRNLAALLLPDVIVLGGGVVLGRGEKLVAPARRIMAEHLHIVPAPEVAISRLAADTTIMGTIAVAMHGLE